MSFTENERVKIYDPTGKWITARYLRKENDTHVVEWANTELFYKDHEVHRYESIDDDEFEEWGRENIHHLQNALKELIKRTGTNLVVDHQINPQDVELSINNRAISITPNAIEIVGIGVVREKPGWNVISWHYSSGSYHNPPEEWDTFIGESRCPYQAAAMALKTLFANQLADALECIGEEQYAKELNEFGEDW